jgi:indole-3-glycerol phosphate synthase
MLDPILADVARRAAERRRVRDVAGLRREVTPDPARGARFVAALARPGLSVIAECKRRSPSAGALSAETDLAARAAAYARGGADALSVLTEEDHFRGSLADLARVADAGLPRLRKDFVLDEGMVLESAAAGAEAVLLIARCLPGALLADLRALAGELGLAVLLEVHEPGELDRALAVAPDALGVNARDLATFSVDLARVEDVLARVPAEARALKVAESGLREVADLERVAAAGADVVLIGEALMRAADPAALLASWKEALGG